MLGSAWPGLAAHKQRRHGSHWPMALDGGSPANSGLPAVRPVGEAARGTKARRGHDL
jgi:hypothetical protein